MILRRDSFYNNEIRKYLTILFHKLSQIPFIDFFNFSTSIKQQQNSISTGIEDNRNSNGGL